MSDPISTVQQTVVNGDIVTTTTEIKTINSDHSVTTTTTVDKTDHADEDNHITTISQKTTPLNELDENIIRQIEYYFSDQHYPHDEILQNEILKDDGWIPVSLLTTCKRLQSIPTDISTILSALKKSLSGLLQIDENQKKIRRHPNTPLSNNPFDFQFRTVLVKGFPQTDRLDLEHLWQFFSEYDSIENIQIQNQSTGSILLVFADEKHAQEFVNKSIRYIDESILECSLYNRPRSNLAGTLIHLADMATNATRELIREKFQPFTKMFWIDYDQGDQEAWVRLNEENTAKDVLDQVLIAGNGKLIIGDHEVRSRIVENDDDDEQFSRRKRRRRETELKKETK